MTEPTSEIRREAATGGFYDSAWGHHPRLQILTIGELLEGKGVNIPPISQVNVMFKREGRGEDSSARWKSYPTDILVMYYHE